MTHPLYKCRHLAGVSVLHLTGFFEQVDEAQPLLRVANEPATGLGLGDLTASTPAGPRPSRGGGLDPGHAHPIAFAKIEKLNQLGLMSRNTTQCAWPGSSLRAMAQITQPFLEKRCSPIAGNGAPLGE